MNATPHHLHFHAQASETGNGPFEVQIALGRHLLTGDEPVQQGGQDSGPAPYQLLCAALAECAAMTVRLFARKHDWPLDRVSVEVSLARKLELVSAQPKDSFVCTLRLDGNSLTAEQRLRLVQVAAHCPVHTTLIGEPRIETIEASG